MIPSSVLWPSLAALVAATVAAFLTAWLRRSRPWAAITSIHRDDTQLVPVPNDLVTAINTNPWFPISLSEESPLRRIMAIGQKATSSIEGCKRIIASVDATGETLHKSRDQHAVAGQLTKLLANGTFRSVMELMNQGDRLPIPENLEVPETQRPVLATEEVVTDEGTTKALLFLDASGKRYPIELGLTRQTIERTKKLGSILQFALDPHLSNILATIRTAMQADLQVLLEIRERVDDLIRSRRLVVRAQITNLGGTPENIEPYGLLRLRSAGKRIEPMIVAVHDYRTYEAGMEDLPRMMQFLEGLAEKQDIEIPQASQKERGVPQYLVIRPGDIVQADLVTLEPVEDEAIIEGLENGILSCQLMLRRSGRTVATWVSSKPQVLGLSLNPERRAELLQKGTK